MQTRIFFLTICLITNLLAFAQVPMGAWRTHFSYQKTNQVVKTKNKVFAVASNHLYSVSPKDGTVDTYTKIDGLSENSVQTIAYNNEYGVLIVAYTNANIDMITDDGTIYNIPDLYKRNMVADKTVNQIYCKDKYAYLATGFGIVVLNLKKYEIAATYIIGDNSSMTPVYGVAASNDSIYALTKGKVQKAALKGSNLLDYSSWQSYFSLPNVDDTYTNLFYLSSVLYTTNGKFVYAYKNNAWSTLNEQEDVNLRVSVRGNDILLTDDVNGVRRYNAEGILVDTQKTYALDALYLSDTDAYYLASGSIGVTYLRNGSVQQYKPISLSVSTVQTMAIENGVLALAPGGSWLNRLDYPAELPIFENEKWTVHDIVDMQLEKFVGYTADIVDVVIDKKDQSHLYIATWGEGVFEIKNGKAVNHFSYDNTGGALSSAVLNNPHYVRVDGLCIDKKGNLWVLNSSVENAIVRMDKNGNWRSYYYPEFTDASLLRKTTFDSKGKLWALAVRNGAGVFVCDTVNVNNHRFFSSFKDQDGRVLSPSLVYDIQEDADGTMWVGTDLGPILLKNTKQIFSSSYTAHRVKIPRNDGSMLADFLLENEPVLTLAIDKGNRKWLGTNNSGVYLLSEDGLNTIYHFTKENSPLSSNNISSIVIDDKTGEVFIASSEGLLSFRSDATAGIQEATSNTVYVFPNPVRPDFDGFITVMGLEDNSYVWITDGMGNVVFEGESNGGAVAWNGKNYSGNDIASGVYFVLVSNAKENNHRAVATKFLVVR